jgi:hypothetical protein
MKFKYSISKKLTDKDIHDFESKFNIKLPVEYKNLLLAHNGGYPDHCFFCIHSAPLHLKEATIRFYGIGIEKGKVSDMTTIMNIVGERIPKGFVAIGDNGSGDLILLAAESSGTSGVFIFDHENESHGRKINWDAFGNIYKISDSFQNFLSGLTLDDAREN